MAPLVHKMRSDTRFDTVVFDRSVRGDARSSDANI